ncbi:sushi repeat-containing protein SRPX2-like [Branchiostoma floridae]|uniref:Sushi repeat-containing protein SRPX2-like n=1 Tax=Branchiostoma floridae TaxID=7739 RepID=A0A9J7KZ30_BRAFL|nr:sushi repeat-containing protein SRPX2-like [Branchiostoma floridae]
MGVKTVFTEGSHHVIYTAEDGAGNRAKCQFTVMVTVHRCKALPPPSFGQFIHTCNNLEGSSCSMECHMGYRLTGSATRTCVVTNNGTTSYWDGVETKCDIYRCSPLPKPTHGTLTPTSCSGQPVAGTQCSFHCESGFEMQNGINTTLCNATGHWSPSVSSTPSCKDVQPPVFTSCPSDVYREPAAGLGTVLVNWDKPTVIDNTAVSIAVSPNGTEPPTVFSVGTHIITYTATDSAGLTATCSFMVNIRDNEKPNITCPNDVEVKTSTVPVEVTWALPVAVDNSEERPTVTSLSHFDPGDDFRYGPELIAYEATDGSGNRATCTFKVLVKATDCPSLNVPANGALVCGIWFFGTYCNPNCEGSDDFPAGYTPSTYVCDTSGTWLTSLDRDAPPARVPIPDCSETSPPTADRQGYINFYYSGNCSDPAVQQQIKISFIDEVTKRFYVVCRHALIRDRDSGGCTIKQVFVT